MYIEWQETVQRLIHRSKALREGCGEDEGTVVWGLQRPWRM